MATIEEIKAAILMYLQGKGYTALATMEKWSKYIDAAKYPLCKLVSENPSRVIQEYATRKKLRQDDLVLYVAAWNTSQNFEAVNAALVEQLDNEIHTEPIRLLLQPEVAKCLGSITVSECQTIIPDASGDNSTPYAMLKVTVPVQYLTK